MTMINNITHISENKFGFTNTNTQFVVVKTEYDADNIQMNDGKNETCKTFEEAVDYLESTIESDLQELIDDWQYMNEDDDELEHHEPAAYQLNDNFYFIIGCSGYKTTYQIIEQPIIAGVR